MTLSDLLTKWPAAVIAVVVTGAVLLAFSYFTDRWILWTPAIGVEKSTRMWEPCGTLTASSALAGSTISAVSTLKQSDGFCYLSMHNGGTAEVAPASSSPTAVWQLKVTPYITGPAFTSTANCIRLAGKEWGAKCVP